MKKKIGLLLLTTSSLLFASCNRSLLRKTAALLVDTYTNFDTTDDKTYEMVKKAKISWNYKSTESSAESEAAELISKLTGNEHPEKGGSKIFDSSNCSYFFEVRNEEGHKTYYNDIIKWNLFNEATSPSGGLPVQVFDLYFSKIDNCQYSSRVNDLFVNDGTIRSRENVDDEGKKIGKGNYHYDSYGRLVEASIKINYKGDNGKVKISLGVSASYNPIKD